MVGVSADNQETQDRFAKGLELPYPLVGDPAGTVRDAYGVKWPLLGLARRVTFVIGKDKRVQLVHKSERDVESHAVLACEYVRKNA